MQAIFLAACAHEPKPAAASPSGHTAAAAEASGKAATAEASAAPDEAPPKAQLPKTVRPTHYALALAIAPDQERFSGTAEIDVELDLPQQAIWMHAKNLHVTKASALQQGAAAEEVLGTLEQAAPDGTARLQLARPIGPGKATLRLAWDAAWDEQLAGLYLAKENGIRYAFTQFEAIDARKAFPCFDEPAFKTPFDVTLTVPKDDTAVANTLPLDEAPAGKPFADGMKTIRYATTKPLPTYLLAWAVGPFDVVETPTLPPNDVRRRPLQIRGIAPKGRGKELTYALETGRALLPILEMYFGIEFPYDKLDHIAVPDYTYGAMENAGAIVYREQAILHDPRTGSEDQKSGIAGTMAHEMAHQWFGDLVTLRWWTDAWLNESFATWMAAHAVQAWNPGMNARVQSLKGTSFAMDRDNLGTARSIRQPVESNDDVWSAFDGITYQKGAAVISMFETWMGPAKFQAGIHAYLASHAHGSGSTDELLKTLGEVSGRDVATPFRTFLEQPGVPMVEVEVETRTAGGMGVFKGQEVWGEALTSRLLLRQSRYVPLGATPEKKKQLWQIPVCARYGSGGVEKQVCTLLSTETGVLPLERADTGFVDWVIPNADSNGYYRWSLAPRDLAALRKAGYAKLTTRERMSLGMSLKSALRSGELALADALPALEVLAHDPDGSVASEPMGVLRQLEDDWTDEALRPSVRRYEAGLYREAVRKLGWKPAPGEPLDRARFREQVLGFEAETARDPEVASQAAGLGQRYAAGFDSKIVDPSLAGLALSMAVREGGARTFDALLARLGTTEDAEARDRILRALASTLDPALSARALALSLDPRLRKNERISLLQRQFVQRETREAAWAWLKQSFDALVAQIPEQHAAGLFGIVGRFCDAEHLADAEAFFGPRAEKIPAAPRRLRQALEDGRICAAQAAAQRAGTQAFFRKAAMTVR